MIIIIRGSEIGAERGGGLAAVSARSNIGVGCCFMFRNLGIGLHVDVGFQQTKTYYMCLFQKKALVRSFGGFTIELLPHALSLCPPQPALQKRIQTREIMVGETR